MFDEEPPTQRCRLSLLEATSPLALQEPRIGFWLDEILAIMSTATESVMSGMQDQVLRPRAVKGVKPQVLRTTTDENQSLNAEAFAENGEIRYASPIVLGKRAIIFTDTSTAVVQHLSQ